MKRLVVLISGNGSNLQALLDAYADGRLAGRVVRVIANRAQAFGLERARLAGVPTEVLALRPYTADGRGRAAYDADLADLVAAAAPDVVVLAGFMHILGAPFLDRFPGRVVNLHPALPGAFPGKDAIGDALAAFARGAITETGVMVHLVVPAVDAGPVLAAEPVPLYPGDTRADLEARIHAVEHRLLVATVARFQPPESAP
ncbi:MAG: phosphoribosylglycinamide formyltransferase [Myxococcales bacterium]|nr:phosphoribosylglycinamide formyltransferase [Myxococcales bacterium]